MEGIRQWAFSACVAAVACGVVRLILPKSNLQKVFGVTASVFFLCCLLSPVALRPQGVRFQAEGYPSAEIESRAQSLLDKVEEQAGEAVGVSMEKIIEGMLDEMGINHMGITINMIPNGQNDPRVESADIILGGEHLADHAFIRHKLEEALGFPVRLSFQADGRYR